MFKLHRDRQRVALLLAISLFVATDFCLGRACAQSQDVTVKVVDFEGAALQGAEVEILEDRGGLKPTRFHGETNADGEIGFEGVECQGHAYLVARHTDFAPVVHFLSIAGQDNVTTTIRLAPATGAFVRVYSPDGKPLAGAEVTRLDFSSKMTGERHFANHDFFMAMMRNDGTAYRSDAEGRLHLPPLPSDAVLSLAVTHPGFAVGKISDVSISGLDDAKIELSKGTIVEAYLAGTPEVMKKLEGTRVEVRTSSRTDSSLLHSFPVQNGKLEFSLLPGRYDSLYLSGSTDLVITPSLPSSTKLAGFAEIPDMERVQKRFVVRELHTVKGRVVTSSGKPAGNLMLDVEYQNLYIDEEGKKRVVEEHPTASDLVTTDREGRFECRVPEGVTSISAWWDSGYYSDPQKMEFVFEGQAEIPDYVVRPMPVLRGTAVNERGEPVPNAILRVVDSTDNYVVAGPDGRFEAQVSVLDKDDEGKTTSRFKTLSAFDLGSRLCCMETIDITNDEAIASLRLELKEHPVNWLLDRWQEKSDREMERMLASSNYMSEEIREFRKRQSEIEANNRFAPDLALGKWLKGIGSSSLSEYRGKYVLLDFWFIGCGPCEQEIPNLKLLHQKFKDRGFSVIGVHIAGQDAEIVEKFMDQQMLEYPMVVDRFDEPIRQAYEPLGLQGYPTYFLVNPDGEIDWGASVRGRMLETIRDRILKLEESKRGSGN